MASLPEIEEMVRERLDTSPRVSGDFMDTADYDATEALRVVEIAEILGVSKQRADQLRREPDFPTPVDRWARGHLWAASDVRRWARTHMGGAARWGER